MVLIGEKGRFLRLDEEGEGRLRLTLGTEGEPDAVCAAMALDDLFVVSLGRPWTPSRPGLVAPDVKGDGEAIRVRGTVADHPALAVDLRLWFENGFLYVDVEFRNEGESPLREAVLGVAVPLPARRPEAVTLPQVYYRGNPSSDPTRTVPRMTGADGSGLVVEDHRLPVPCAHAEWGAGATAWYATLYAVRPGDGSLGALPAGRRVALVGASGATLFAGRPDTAYVHKNRTAPYGGGYLDLPPGAAHRTRHALDWGRPARRGHGFRAAVHRGLDLYRPRGARPLDLDAIVRHKERALDRRWYDAEGAAGYLKFISPGHTPGFMYGWTGQALKLAWCDARLGVDHAERWRIQRARSAVDFYLDGSAAPDAPGLRLSFYATEERAWSGFTRDDIGPFVSARAYGDTLCDLADVIELFRAHGHAVPHRWVAALLDGVNATCGEGETPPPYGWRPDGSPLPGDGSAAGLPCVLALLKAHRVTGDRDLLRRAERLTDLYRRRNATDFTTPFAHATLDAACEDKEGGIGYFLCALELLRLTGKKRWATAARTAADWLLTWVYQWDPPFENGFRTTGWPGVSVQNHHVDVFFPAYELALLGDTLNEPIYRRLGETTLHAFGQGICTRPGEWGFQGVGEQAEGFFPTNWQDRGTSNTWNPSWVTAQVLSQALRMRNR
ncbi:hypothetical protein OG785_41590 [Streptomyces sp. NBC_00006]|uniref:hypothetical protein n=1 Tax=unclassified Streptomyces TaxID=2593676 RepID=UPI00225259AB|nr:MULTISPECIES: hypothetical protein [unclassified Streptomyces]MCX5537046.1 hypothetical protein [Streptomyces sp. NBC_00006]